MTGRCGQYHWQYDSFDYGTERTLTVRSPEGAIVGQCDPYHRGVPVNARQRGQVLADAIRSIVVKHKESVLQ